MQAGDPNRAQRPAENWRASGPRVTALDDARMPSGAVFMARPKSGKSSVKPVKLKSAPRRSSAGRKGSPMFKLMFLALLVGAGYVAFTVPYHGRTVADRVTARAKHYIEYDGDERPAHPARPPSDGKTQMARSDSKHAPVVADRRAPADHSPKSSEQNTRADRDALNRLIPR